MTDLERRLAEARERIAAAAGRAGRAASEVRIVAVTKGFPAPAVREAIVAGVTAIGENRGQELLEKATEVEAPEWHFLGRIQRNKIARLSAVVVVWHSVDRLVVAEAIAHRSPGARVYIQVNLAAEPQKGGCEPGAVADLAERFLGVGLTVEGLMTVPPEGEDPRPHFARLRELGESTGVAGLSMGMSADYEVAVEEGATIVRLGSALFGVRPE